MSPTSASVRALREDAWSTGAVPRGIRHLTGTHILSAGYGSGECADKGRMARCAVLPSSMPCRRLQYTSHTGRCALDSQPAAQDRRGVVRRSPESSVLRRGGARPGRPDACDRRAYAVGMDTIPLGLREEWRKMVPDGAWKVGMVPDGADPAEVEAALAAAAGPSFPTATVRWLGSRAACS